MGKCLLFFVIVFFSFQSYSQELVYTSNGNITDSNGVRISPTKMRELLSENLRILANYNEGRSQKTAGNILLIGGLASLIADVAVGANADVKFPSALTYVGIAFIAIAIPVKIGFSKKIANVVSDYNTQKSVGYSELNHNKFELISNSNGFGLRLTLN